jgi:SAM-dependent methyltransferase
MLEQTNLGDYADPIIYDSENPPEKTEATLRFYLDVCRRTGGSVLELGCGTGRFTISLAQAGVKITGLDVVPAMVARAREKAGTLPITWVEADARRFQLNQRFDVIFESGAMFQHLLERTDHEACLACVREHLASDGLFVLSVTFPNKGMMKIAEHHDWFEHTDALGRHVRVSGDVRYDPVHQTYHENATRRWVGEGGEEVIAYAPMTLRLFFPQELEALLHYNGFEIVERYGDWDRSAVREGGPSLICVCCLRQS